METITRLLKSFVEKTSKACTRSPKGYLIMREFEHWSFLVFVNHLLNMITARPHKDFIVWNEEMGSKHAIFTTDLRHVFAKLFGDPEPVSVDHKILFGVFDLPICLQKLQPRINQRMVNDSGCKERAYNVNIFIYAFR